MHLRRTKFRCRIGMRPVRKFSQEVSELIERGSGAECRPLELFQSCSCEAFRHAAREARQVIAQFLRVVACLDEISVGELLGLTEFPRIGLKFRGRMGEALLFENVLANGVGDMNTLHTGRPPSRGEKWLLSQWIRRKSQLIV